MRAAITSIWLAPVICWACAACVQKPIDASNAPTQARQGLATTPNGGAVSNVAGTSNVFVELSRRVIPSVVNISTVTRLDRSPGGIRPEEFFRRFFEEFFGRRGGQMPFPFPGDLFNTTALGTGFIIDTDGTILTNNHVVQGATEILISFTEVKTDRPVKAKVVGRDPDLDIALLKVESPDRSFQPVVLGDSDTVEIGEYVMAVGNPFGQGHSVTHGIISQKGRMSPDFPLTTYLQTDAPINPGNSGGPLVNLKGEVIAVNNAIQANAQGIGFAIPINVVKNVLPELREKGRIVRGYLGVAVQDLTPEIAKQLGIGEIRAPFVVQVTEGSPGHKAGIQPYDVITSFNNQPVASASELIGSVSAIAPGKSVPVVIKREGKGRKLHVTLGERPIR